MGQSRVVMWLYRFHTSQRSCATATGEEELEELEEEKTKCGKCHGRYLCAGRFSTRWHIFA